MLKYTDTDVHNNIANGIATTINQMYSFGDGKLVHEVESYGFRSIFPHELTSARAGSKKLMDGSNLSVLLQISFSTAETDRNVSNRNMLFHKKLEEGLWRSHLFCLYSLMCPRGYLKFILDGLTFITR